MAKISVKRFVELIQKSGLLPDLVLRDALTQLKKENDGAPLADTGFVARRLIAMDLITQWQSEKLLSQKYKGFFLGKYKILGHIGTGGMSSVYLVEHLQMHQRRAIKVLPRKRVSDKTYLERFYLEARASASLDHPNIVRAFDVDHDKDTETHYLIMEYVDGRDVGKIVEEDGPIDPRDAASYIAQASDALQFAHDNGVVHRDVKPGNLLVDKNNEVKVLDMGLALFKEDEFSLTLEYNEKILGTADYLAPEQAMNSHTVDHRADIYGLGCTLYFMLAGQPPFNEGSLAQRIVMHQSREPKAISELKPDCPPALQRILESMMVKDPKDRIQTCSEVKRLMTDLLAGRPISIRSTSPVASVSGPGGNSDVLESGIDRNPDPDKPQHESTKASTDETIRRAAAASSSASHSKIRLNAVSFSDIVAGSEVHSATDASPSLPLASTPIPGQDTHFSTIGSPTKSDGESTKESGNSHRSIEVSAWLLVMIVLFSVFASSAFTILVLDWLNMLGGYSP